jgi:hypothetical protein
MKPRLETCITLSEEIAVANFKAKVDYNLGIPRCIMHKYNNITSRRFKVFVAFNILIGILLVLTSCLPKGSYTNFFFQKYSTFIFK